MILKVFSQLLYIFQGVCRHNALDGIIRIILLNHADHCLSAVFFYSFSYSFSFSFYDAFSDSFSFSLSFSVFEQGLGKLFLIKLREYHIIQLLSGSLLSLHLSFIHPSGVIYVVGICHSPLMKGRLPILQFNNSR